MFDFTHDLLIESKSARETGISKLKLQHSEERILNKASKAKSLFFAVWQDILVAVYTALCKGCVDLRVQLTKQEPADIVELPHLLNINGFMPCLKMIQTRLLFLMLLVYPICPKETSPGTNIAVMQIKYLLTILAVSFSLIAIGSTNAPSS